MNDVDQITDLIHKSAEDESAKDALYDSVYQNLKNLARKHLNGANRDHYQTTALVNDVVIRMQGSGGLSNLANRRVFFAIASRAMKNILIDHYRKQQRRIESGERAAEPLDEIIQRIEVETKYDYEQLSIELDRLEKDSPRQHAVIMHRFFGGLTVPETAELLDISPSTVERDWRLARVKLFARLNEKAETE